MSRFRLQRDGQGLGLVDIMSNQRPLRVDFTTPRLLARLERAGRSELLARAVGAKPGLRVIDCTAGLGMDALLLGWLGCEVTLVERSIVIHRLLQDGLQRAGHPPRLAAVVARLHLRHADAGKVLREEAAFAVAVIDPMFPGGRSAASRGDMQILQRFLGQDDDVTGLLDQALAAGIPRVVVKRPLRAPLDQRVAHSIKGSSSRFDVFLQ